MNLLDYYDRVAEVPPATLSLPAMPWLPSGVHLDKVVRNLAAAIVAEERIASEAARREQTLVALLSNVSRREAGLAKAIGDVKAETKQVEDDCRLLCTAALRETGRTLFDMSGNRDAKLRAVFTYLDRKYPQEARHSAVAARAASAGSSGHHGRGRAAKPNRSSSNSELS